VEGGFLFLRVGESSGHKISVDPRSGPMQFMSDEVFIHRCNCCL